MSEATDTGPKPIATGAMLLSAILFTGPLSHFLLPNESRYVLVLVTVAAFAICVWQRSRAGIALTLFTALCGIWWLSGIWPPGWPLAPLAPLAAFLVIGYFTSIGSSLRGWFVWGHTERSLGVLLLATVVLSGVGLLVWNQLVQPDLSRFQAFIPNVGPLGVVAAGLAFSLINAFVEETIFRGLFQSTF